MPESFEDKKRDELLKRMLQTPHQPHIGKTSLTKSVKKKDDGPPMKKSRRPQDS